MNRAHVIRLNPTPEQVVYIRKACGVARHAYNWALARWKDYRVEGKWAKMNELKAEYNRIKGEQFPWCYEITKCAPEQEFSNLGQASANHCLAQAVSDANFFEVQRQLLYKTEQYGGYVQPVSRWYPSSKTCHACGWIKEENWRSMFVSGPVSSVVRSTSEISMRP